MTHFNNSSTCFMKIVLVKKGFFVGPQSKLIFLMCDLSVPLLLAIAALEPQANPCGLRGNHMHVAAPTADIHPSSASA